MVTSSTICAARSFSETARLVGAFFPLLLCGLGGLRSGRSSSSGAGSTEGLFSATAGGAFLHFALLAESSSEISLESAAVATTTFLGRPLLSTLGSAATAFFSSSCCCRSPCFLEALPGYFFFFGDSMNFFLLLFFLPLGGNFFCAFFDFDATAAGWTSSAA